MYIVALFHNKRGKYIYFFSVFLMFCSETIELEWVWFVFPDVGSLANSVVYILEGKAAFNIKNYIFFCQQITKI